MMSDPMAQWPDLPLQAWSETCDTLQLWTQIAGKIRIALTPLINHWWNATFFVTARGLAAPAIPYRGRSFDIDFDFIDHRFDIETSDGRGDGFKLEPMTVADFYARVIQALRRLEIDIKIRTMPCEIEGAVPFDSDSVHAQYAAAYAQKFWLALVQANRVMNEFRARFVGKASPVHFFWGSFDLAVTRFSGRTAPRLTSGAAHLGAWVMQEAYSHEVSSCGFWPGNGGFGQPAFFSYAYPEPPGFAAAPVRPAGTYYDQGLGQFILPYDAVRLAPSPDADLLDYLDSTYAAAADLGHWDRAALERTRRDAT